MRLCHYHKMSVIIMIGEFQGLTRLKTMYKSVMSKAQREIKTHPAKIGLTEILKIFSRRGIVSDV